MHRRSVREDARNVSPASVLLVQSLLGVVWSNALTVGDEEASELQNVSDGYVVGFPSSSRALRGCGGVAGNWVRFTSDSGSTSGLSTSKATATIHDKWKEQRVGPVAVGKGWRE